MRRVKRSDDMVCEVCGLTLDLTHRDNWKHRASRDNPSCGGTPRPVTRAQFDAFIDGVAQEIRRHRREEARRIQNNQMEEQ